MPTTLTVTDQGTEYNMSLIINSGFAIGPGVILNSGHPTSLGPSYPTDSLVLYLDASNTASYPGTGSNWNDLSGAGNNFVFNNGVSFTSAGQQSYFYFGGVAEGGAILNSTSYTKIAIFQAAGAFSNIISADGSADHAFWGAGGTILQSGHNGSWYTIQSSTPVTPNQWTFGAVSFNTTTGWKLYLQNEAPTTSGDTTPPNTNPATVEIGGFEGNTNNMNGDVALVMIYNRVLTDAEIAEVYAYFQTRFSLP